MHRAPEQEFGTICCRLALRQGIRLREDKTEKDGVLVLVEGICSEHGFFFWLYWEPHPSSLQLPPAHNVSTPYKFIAGALMCIPISL